MEKKDNILRYYEEEMQYLNKAAQSFAEAHPESAKYLNLENSLERDPMVERLFEGFSFLTAKLYQKIDDDMPELTESVLGLLWPQYLQPIPSMSIIQLDMNKNIHIDQQHIDSGLLLYTAEDPNTSTACEYRTTQPIDVYPIEIEEGKLIHNDLGQSIIQFKFHLNNIEFGKEVNMPDVFNLKIYLSGEVETKLTLFHFLINHVSYITTDENDIKKNKDMSISRVHCDCDSVTWKGSKTVSEHDLLLEYFLFKEKFLFFEIKNIQKKQFSKKNSIIINCHLSRDFPLELGFNKNNFNLFCAPAINVFELEAEPIIRSHLKNEYKLLPVHKLAKDIFIYSIADVNSFNEKTGERKHYLPFHEFKHGKIQLDINKKDIPYYYLRCREDINKQYSSYISFGGDFIFDDKEILSINAMGINLNLPRQICKYNKVLKLSKPVLGVKNAKMMMVPTAVQYPPNFKNQQWQLLFEMSHNYLSILDINVLKNSLRLLNWSSSNNNKKYIDAIQSIENHITHIMHSGMMIRCLVIDIELNSNQFINEGDAALFSFVINNFLNDYAQLNLAVKVNFTLQPYNILLNWPMRINNSYDK